MSGDERDIDVESADEVPDVGLEATAATDDDPQLEDGGEGGGVDKRAHHNALERQRRDHIKDSFHSLRDCIPALHSEKVGRGGGGLSKYGSCFASLLLLDGRCYEAETWTILLLLRCVLRDSIFVKFWRGHIIIFRPI